MVDAAKRDTAKGDKARKGNISDWTFLLYSFMHSYIYTWSYHYLKGWYPILL